MRTRPTLLLVLCLLSACGDKGDDTADTGAADDTATTDDGGGEDAVDDDEAEVRVGFELLEVRSASEIIVWINRAQLTQAEFEAIELPQGWMRNQPREGEPDFGSFAMSPDATEEGEFTTAEHFGLPWMHNATVLAANEPVDAEGLLSLNTVAKHHTIGWNAGRAVHVLTSPEGVHYLRVSRDANRTSDDPTLPAGWVLTDQTLDAELVVTLPNPTANLRYDNEDSFQGPVSADLLGL